MTSVLKKASQYADLIAAGLVVMVVVMLVIPLPSVLLDMAITQPCLYGAGDPVVLERLFQLLRELAWTVRTPDQRAAVSRQLERVRAAVARQDFEFDDDHRLQAVAALVDAALLRAWPIGRPPPPNLRSPWSDRPHVP